MAELQQLLACVNTNGKPSIQLPNNFFNLKAEVSVTGSNAVAATPVPSEMTNGVAPPQQYPQQAQPAGSGAATAKVEMVGPSDDDATDNMMAMMMSSMPGKGMDGMSSMPPGGKPGMMPQFDYEAALNMRTPPDSKNPTPSHTPLPPGSFDYLMENGSDSSMSSSPTASSFNSRAMLQDASQQLSGDRKNLVKQVMQAIMDAHLNTCNYTVDKVREGTEKYQRMKDSGMLPSPEQMMAKGANPSDMWGKFVANMVPVITRVVKFCKRMPGFLELDEEDQVRLIKQGSFEVVLARYTPLFDEDGMFTPSMEMKIPLFMVKKMPMGEFFEMQVKFGVMFNRMNMTDGEKGLLTALMIMNPSREGLKTKKAVSKLQGLFAQCLYSFLKEHYPESADNRFIQQVEFLPQLQQINEGHSKMLNNMKMAMPHAASELPPLHKEVYDLE